MRTNVAHQVRGYRVAYVGSFAVLFESIIRPSSRDGFPDFLKPSGPDVCVAVKLWHVGLDVEQRCAVQNVHVLDTKDTVFDTVQCDYGKAYGVRPLGGASGKDAPGLGVHERDEPQAESLAAVEMVEQDDVREAIEILQSCLVLFKYLDCSVNTGGTRRLNGHAFRRGEGRMDDTDGLEFNHALLTRTFEFSGGQRRSAGTKG